LLAQLDKAIAEGAKEFNMSGGEQLRDYLPVETVAENIVRAAIDPAMNGIYNCCSGVPVSVKAMVENHLANKNLKIRLNLGCYPYNDYEPMAFWGVK
jgi:dTDP-6-deoxy-L-talose 4-dehydrogenase (NAD+)